MISMMQNRNYFVCSFYVTSASVLFRLLNTNRDFRTNFNYEISRLMMIHLNCEKFPVVTVLIAFLHKINLP